MLAPILGSSPNVSTAKTRSCSNHLEFDELVGFFIQRGGANDLCCDAAPLGNLFIFRQVGNEGLRVRCFGRGRAKNLKLHLGVGHER